MVLQGLIARRNGRTCFGLTPIFTRRCAASGSESSRPPEAGPADSQEPANQLPRPARPASRTPPAVEAAAAGTSPSATGPARIAEAGPAAVQTAEEAVSTLALTRLPRR